MVLRLVEKHELLEVFRFLLPKFQEPGKALDYGDGYIGFPLQNLGKVTGRFQAYLLRNKPMGEVIVLLLLFFVKITKKQPVIQVFKYWLHE